MSVNEVLQPVAQADLDQVQAQVDSAFNEMNTPPSGGFVYERADGTVEVAASPEDAMRRCPVLGKMSLEQANVLLELSSIGKEKIEADKQQKQDQSKVDKPIEPTTKATKEAVKDHPEVKDIDHQTTPLKPVLIERPQIRIPEPQKDRQETIEPVLTQMSEHTRASDEEARKVHGTEDALTRSAIVQETVSSSYTPPEIRAKVVNHSSYDVSRPSIEVKNEQTRLAHITLEDTRSYMQEAEAIQYPVIKPEILVHAEMPGNTPTVLAPEVAWSTMVVEHDIKGTDKDITLYSEYVDPAVTDPFVDGETLGIMLDEETKLLPEDVTIQSDVGLDYEAPIETAQELEIDEETIGLFHQLLALNEATDEVALIDPADTSVIIDTEGISSIDIDSEPAIDSTKDYFEAQPLLEESIDLETIKLSAEDQTLEETLIRLAAYLSEVPETESIDTDDIEASETVYVKQLLTEIEETLTRPYREGLDKTEPLQITPEITQKLLSLLRAIGYENPQEVLMQFVSHHSLEFLLQAMRYLYQLTNDDNQHEMQSSNTPVSASITNDDTISARLGRTLLGLLSIGQDTKSKPLTTVSTYA